MKPASIPMLGTLVIGLSLAGCGLPDRPGLSGAGADGYPRVVARGVAIAPYDAPHPGSFGDRQVRDLVGGQVSTLRLGASRNRLRIEDGTGCVSTRLKDWFAPAVAWQDCGRSADWHTAKARVGVRDRLYPLETGASGRYQRWATSHTGRRSERTTDCIVRDAVTLDLGHRVADAFEVRCDDGRVERITWYAPAEGPVAYREAHRERGLRKAWIRAD
ncbi:MAG: hypothetical protein AAFR52_17245 [Pseudomonadota bacterium]